jgi:hypothetical protein
MNDPEDRARCQRRPKFDAVASGDRFHASTAHAGRLDQDRRRDSRTPRLVPAPVILGRLVAGLLVDEADVEQ